MRRLGYPGPGFDRYVAGLAAGSAPRPGVERAVEAILRAVRRDGDAALVALTWRFDGVRLAPRALRAGRDEIRAIARRADPAVVAALRAMARRVEAYHRRQREAGFRLALGRGSWLREAVTPLPSAGLYVPGGAGAYPSSVLMNAIPARVAGVPRIAVATPPRALETSPAVAAALVVAGVDAEVYRVGGAQAVAALAFGTRSIAPVVKIVGPGNAFVAAAKRRVRGRVEIDTDAGPSEVAVLADDSADAGYVAADLLAQAEHGSGDEAVVLITTSLRLADEVERLVREGVRSVANPASAQRALRRRGAIVRVSDLAAGVAALNALAPEHAEIHTRRAGSVARRVVAGAVFVGPFAPVAAGDYGIGPNHVLPTGGAAARSSPLSVRDFVRRQSVVCLTRRGLERVAGDVVRLARAEGFPGHAVSVLARFADASGGRR